MGERKGTNKYYPPDYDPKKGGLNKFMGTHALRERARKLHLGILIIRFEMPYNIWCEGCNNHIGMGVRYNAEKTKIGMYYSTPVYQFRMKCHLCDNHFEIKTDPGNLDYVITSGARRQERRWDPTENGQVVPDDKTVIHKLADDAMFKLQHGVEDKTKLKDVAPSIAKLENLQERWKDDYMANKKLRDVFRARKRELQDQQAKDQEFLKKRSLDIPLLKETEDDTKVASLIRLQPSLSVDERQKAKRSEINKKSKFPFPLMEPPSPGKSDHATVDKRRLMFGVKLKTNNASATSTITSENLDVPNSTPLAIHLGATTPESDKASSKVQFESKDADEEIRNLNNGSESEKPSTVVQSNLTETSGPGPSVPCCSKSSELQSSSATNSLFSSLVSYSDDSMSSSDKDDS